ncbi:MAG: tyrosine-type recombinase/integrase, partial [Deltaproteobacteria bacterium]
PTEANVSIEGSPSTPISPTPPKIAPPSHPLSTKAIQAGSWSSTNTIIHAGATTTAGYAHIFHLQANERNSPPPSIKVPLFRDLLAAQTKFPSENSPRSSTIRGYWLSLFNAIETVSYARAGRLQDKPCRSGRKVSYEEFLFLSNGVTRPIMDCEISILDMLLADDFYNARMKSRTGRRTGSSKKRKRSAKISAKSELRQIRSLFKPSWAKVAYLRAGLKIPVEVHEFLGYSPGGPSRPPIRFSPTPDQVRELFRFLHESVDKKDLHFAIVVVLALLAGLRHSEITHARKSWLKNTAWGYVLEVKSELDFTVKGERERVVHLEPWLYDWLHSVSDREYLLSDVRAERNRTADRVLQKLRDLGFDTDKPLHCLRALYAAFLRATVKDEKDITQQMGHSDIRTTVTYYAPLPLARKLVPLWRQTLNSLGPRPQQMVLDFAA